MKRLAVLLALALLAIIPPSVSAASCATSNRWSLLQRGPDLDMTATLTLGAVTPGQYVWIASTGTQSLDIIQVGAVRQADDGERRMFVAWGRGEPGAPGSLYEQRDLNLVSTGPHNYQLRLDAGVWRLYGDGVKLWEVSDSFRTWTIRASQAAVEAEYPNGLLGGTAAAPAVVAGFPGSSFDYCFPRQSRFAIGSDWLKVWRR